MATKTNAEIAAAFEELGDLYELDGAVSYRVIAYRTAAKAVRDASVSIMALTREGKVTTVPGDRQDARGEAARARRDRRHPVRGQAARQVPARADLDHAPARLRRQAGEAALRRARDRLAGEAARGRRGGADPRASAGSARASRRTCCGCWPSRRRAAGPRRASCSRARSRSRSRSRARCATIPPPTASRSPAPCAGWATRPRTSTSSPPPSDVQALISTLAELPLVESVAASGEAGARVVTHSGMKVDLRVVAPEQFGNVLQHFTGAKAHNVQLREAAVRRGLHVSEYGILSDEDGTTLTCATEEEVYERLGYAWIPPELREGRGELEAAANGSLPALIELSDLRGDLHCHTTLSDGRQTLEQMAEEALRRGWEYLAVTDHSASHGFGDHVTPEALEARIEEVAALERPAGGPAARARRDGVQHPPGRVAGLPGRAAGAPGLGDRLDPHLLRHGRGDDDRPHGRRRRAPLARRDRPPDRPQDRDPPALRDRHDPRDRRGGRERDDDRDQRRPGPPRHEREPRPRRGRGGRDDPRSTPTPTRPRTSSCSSTASPPPAAPG